MDIDFTVGKCSYFDSAELGIELCRNRFCQRTVRVTGEQLDFIAVSYHEVPSFIFYPSAERFTAFRKPNLFIRSVTP